MSDGTLGLKPVHARYMHQIAETGGRHDHETRAYFALSRNRILVLGSNATSDPMHAVVETSCDKYEWFFYLLGVKDLVWSSCSA